MRLKLIGPFERFLRNIEKRRKIAFMKRPSEKFFINSDDVSEYAT
jgi:hypothetical protein